MAAKLECRGVDGLLGVTQWRKGRMALRAVKRVEGTASGSDEMKGMSRDGVDSWVELDIVSFRSPLEINVSLYYKE